MYKKGQKMVGGGREVICSGVAQLGESNSGIYVLTNPIPSYPPTNKMGRD